MRYAIGAAVVTLLAAIVMLAYVCSMPSKVKMHEHDTIVQLDEMNHEQLIELAELGMEYRKELESRRLESIQAQERLEREARLREEKLIAANDCQAKYEQEYKRYLVEVNERREHRELEDRNRHIREQLDRERLDKYKLAVQLSQHQRNQRSRPTNVESDFNFNDRDLNHRSHAINNPISDGARSKNLRFLQGKVDRMVKYLNSPVNNWYEAKQVAEDLVRIGEDHPDVRIGVSMEALSVYLDNDRPVYVVETQSSRMVGYVEQDPPYHIEVYAFDKGDVFEVIPVRRADIQNKRLASPVDWLGVQ